MRPLLSQLTASCSLLALLGAAACISPTDPLGRQEALENSQRRYTQLVRWGDLEKASLFVDPELRDEFLRHAQAFDAIRISDYEIGELDLSQRNVARVTVTYHAYSMATVRERAIREEQEWYRDGISNEWLVRPSLAKFVEAFGSVN